MPDPYAANEERPAVGEVRGHREEVLERFRQLGATDEELAVVTVEWDDLTGAERDELRFAGDHELTAALERARTEHYEGTHTEDEEAAERAELAYRAAVVEAGERIGGNVDSVLAWVAGDVDKARAVLETEPPLDAGGRKTLIEPLVELVNAAAHDEDPDPFETAFLAHGMEETATVGWADEMYDVRDTLAQLYGEDNDTVTRALLGALVGEPEYLQGYGVTIELPAPDAPAAVKVESIARQIVEAVDAQLPQGGSEEPSGSVDPSGTLESTSGDESHGSGDVSG